MHTPEARKDEFAESIATATGLLIALATSCGFWLIVGIVVTLTAPR